MFLSDYAAWLMGCGATCARIEKNIRRMSEAFGMPIKLFRNSAGRFWAFLE